MWPLSPKDPHQVYKQEKVPSDTGLIIGLDDKNVEWIRGTQMVIKTAEHFTPKSTQSGRAPSLVRGT